MAKNRKIPRKENVLDVKARSDRVMRRRMQILLMSLLFCVLFLAGAAAVKYGGTRAITEFLSHDSFLVHQIEVKSDGLIRRERLLDWAELREGQNLFVLDLPRIKENLEVIPAISSASVERVMPGTVILRVRERSPVVKAPLLLPTPEGSYRRVTYYLDQEGHVLLPMRDEECTEAALERIARLPVLTGVKPTDLQIGRRVKSDTILAALRLVQAFDKDPMSERTRLDFLDVSHLRTVQATAGTGTQVTFGFDRLEAQLQRWSLIEEKGDEQGWKFTYLDLSVTNNIPAAYEAKDTSEGPATTEPVEDDRRRNV